MMVMATLIFFSRLMVLIMTFKASLIMLLILFSRSRAGGHGYDLIKVGKQSLVRSVCPKPHSQYLAVSLISDLKTFVLSLDGKLLLVKKTFQDNFVKC